MSVESTAAHEPAEHHLQTIRTGRYYTVGASPRETRCVWIVLHGYAQLAGRMLRHFEGITPADTMIVAPEALSRFYLEMPRADGGHMARIGAAWLTREDRLAEIADANGWLDSVYHAVVDGVVRASGQIPRVGVLAFSQGVATAMRWVANGVVEPARFVLWAGGLAQDIAPDILSTRLAGMDVVLVFGDRDEFINATGRERIHGALTKAGVTVRELMFEGTHELAPSVIAPLLKL